MKKISLFLLLFVVGCATQPVPVVARFPEANKYILEKCSPLKKIEADPKLSDVAKTVSENYSLYHECSAKTDSWIEWYQKQKQIYEKASD